MSHKALREAEARRERDVNLATAAVVLGRSLDADDARLLLGAVMPLDGEDLRDLLKELREEMRCERAWTADGVRDLVLRLGSDGRPFSANRFYAELPPAAWGLIGPALQSLRHRHFETVGTELAANPARKRSLVTVYRLRQGS